MPRMVNVIHGPHFFIGALIAIVGWTKKRRPISINLSCKIAKNLIFIKNGKYFNLYTLSI